MDFQILGAFQLDNLMRARVPFVLVRTNMDIEGVFGVMEKMHLRNVSIVLEKLDAIELLPKFTERNLTKNDPIVILDHEESPAKALAENLATLGYTNVFYVGGGWNKMRDEIIELAKTR